MPEIKARLLEGCPPAPGAIVDVIRRAIRGDQ
jgi:hypothetical protein